MSSRRQATPRSGLTLPQGMSDDVQDDGSHADAHSTRQRGRARDSAREPVLYASPIAGILNALSEEIVLRVFELLDPPDLLSVARARCVWLPRLQCQRARQQLLTRSSKRTHAFVMERSRQLFERAFMIKGWPKEK